MEEKPEEQAPQTENTEQAPPAEGEQAPAEGEQAPAEGEQAPAGGEAPAEGEEAPAEAAGEEEPAPPRKPKDPSLHFDEEMRAEIKDCFYYYDRRRQNKVSGSDLNKMLSTLGKPCTDDDKEAFLKQIDPNNTGYINLNGLYIVMKALEGDTTHEDDVMTTFKLFDFNKKGSIGKEELKDVLGRLGPISDETVDSIMAAADSTGSGTITRQEFLDLFA